MNNDRFKFRAWNGSKMVYGEPGGLSMFWIHPPFILNPELKNKEE